jgi:hypothetical protein
MLFSFITVPTKWLVTARTKKPLASDITLANCDGPVNIRNSDALEVERKPIHIIGGLYTKRSS